MGPVVECGPPPSLARRSLMISSMATPGLISSIPWLQVSMDTVSPESTTSLGFSVASYQPHCTVSLFAGSTWCLPVDFCAAVFSEVFWARAFVQNEIQKIKMEAAKVGGKERI